MHSRLSFHPPPRVCAVSLKWRHSHCVFWLFFLSETRVRKKGGRGTKFLYPRALARSSKFVAVALILKYWCSRSRSQFFKLMSTQSRSWQMSNVHWFVVPCTYIIVYYFTWTASFLTDFSSVGRHVKGLLIASVVQLKIALMDSLFLKRPRFWTLKLSCAYFSMSISIEVVTERLLGPRWRPLAWLAAFCKAMGSTMRLWAFLCSEGWSTS